MGKVFIRRNSFAMSMQQPPTRISLSVIRSMIESLRNLPFVSVLDHMLCSLVELQVINTQVLEVFLYTSAQEMPLDALQSQLRELDSRLDSWQSTLQLAGKSPRSIVADDIDGVH